MKTIDLKSRQCPETFLYTKLALEKLSAGESLCVSLSSSEDAERISRSIAEEGYAVKGGVEAPENGGYLITIYAR